MNEDFLNHILKTVLSTKFGYFTFFGQNYACVRNFFIEEYKLFFSRCYYRN